MPIKAECANCGAVLGAPDRLAGKKARCSSCGATIDIPVGPSDTPAPAAHALSLGPGPDDGPQPEAPPRAVARPTSNARAPRGPASGLLTSPTPAPSGPGRHLYFAFSLALVPLAFSLLAAEDESEMEGRLERTIETYADDLKRIAQSNEIQELAGQLPPGLSEEDVGSYIFSASLQKLMESVPGARLDGAHLSGDSWMHWAYALVASAAFLGIVILIFERGKATPRGLLLTGLFTGTLGIIFLLGVQWVAAFTQGFWIRGRGIITIIFYLLKFIGFSYRSALDPGNGFLLSFMGFTCGVGLCEEIAKALPVVFHYRNKGDFGWRAACALGLASGVGFGVSEGITYSSDFYNGYQTGGIYLVRFVSCVALHAIWSASVGITLYNRREYIKRMAGWADWGKELVVVVAVPMVLHGLYDTMLKREMNAAALLTAIVSFGFMAWLVEKARARDAEDVSPRRALSGV